MLLYRAHFLRHSDAWSNANSEWKRGWIWLHTILRDQKVVPSRLFQNTGTWHTEPCTPRSYQSSTHVDSSISAVESQSKVDWVCDTFIQGSFPEALRCMKQCKFRMEERLNLTAYHFKGSEGCSIKVVPEHWYLTHWALHTKVLSVINPCWLIHFSSRIPVQGGLIVQHFYTGLISWGTQMHEATQIQHGREAEFDCILFWGIGKRIFTM